MDINFLPQSIQKHLEKYCPGQEIHVALTSDLTRQLVYGEEWLIATDKNLATFSIENGAAKILSLHILSDIHHIEAVNLTGSGVIETYNCVFWDPRDGAVDTGIQFTNVLEFDSLFDDPAYVNVGPAVPDFELDFHLKPDSPALTGGVDEDGDPTFAGSQGPAQQ